MLNWSLLLWMLIYHLKKFIKNLIINTLKLDKMYISETIWEEIKDKNNISYNKYWEELKFDKDGNLKTMI